LKLLEQNLSCQSGISNCTDVTRLATTPTTTS